MRQNNRFLHKKNIPHSAVAYSPARGKRTQTRRIFFLDTFNPCFEWFAPFLRVLKCFHIQKGFKAFQSSGIGLNILRNKSALVVGIRAVFTCFQHPRPRKRSFLHEIKQEIASTSITGNWGKIGDTYIHTSKYRKWTGIGEGNPGWHVLDRN